MSSRKCMQFETNFPSANFFFFFFFSNNPPEFLAFEIFLGRVNVEKMYTFFFLWR